MKAFLYFTGAIVCLILFGCKPKETALSGQVFVITQDNETIRLGGVKVLLISKQETTNFTTRKFAPIKLQIEKAEKMADDSFNAVQEAQNAEQFYLTNHTVLDGVMFVATPGRVYDDAEHDRLVKKVTEMYTKMYSAQDYLKSVIPTAQEFLADFSPKVIQQCETDADGRFSLIYPSKTTFVIFVQTELLIGTQSEKLCWLVDTPSDSEKEQVLLNNNNRFMPSSETSLKPR